MKKEDLDAVAEIAILANPQARKEEYRVHLTRWLNDFGHLALVAEKDAKVVGYVTGEASGNMAWIQDIAVVQTHQRKGIGNQLLNEELKALRKHKPKVIVLEVHWKNAVAIPFYYKNGFRISGFSRNRFGLGHDAISLEIEPQ